MSCSFKAIVRDRELRRGAFNDRMNGRSILGPHDNVNSVTLSRKTVSALHSNASSISSSLRDGYLQGGSSEARDRFPSHFPLTLETRADHGPV